MTQTTILSKITENIENINKKIIQQSKQPSETQVSRKSLKTIQVNNEKLATKQNLMPKNVIQTKITEKLKRKPSTRSSKLTFK